MDSKQRRRIAGLVATAAASAALLPGATASGSAPNRAGASYGPDSATITNPYLPISESRRCVLRGKDGSQHLRIARVLRPRTKAFELGGGTVRAAVVRDSVTSTVTGRLIERTIDYFAQDRAGGVHYFGEDVSEFRAGGGVSHEGQWRLGRDTSHAGLLMPAHPSTGDRFRSEDARVIAVEHDRVIGSGRTETIAGHTYRHVIKIREHATTPKPAEVEYKTYAPAAGVLTEANGGVHLVGCSGAPR